MTEILEILTKTTLILARALGSTETKARLSCCLSAKPFINLAHNACASVRSWLDIILVRYVLVGSSVRLGSLTSLSFKQLAQGRVPALQLIAVQWRKAIHASSSDDRPGSVPTVMSPLSLRSVCKSWPLGQAL